jgi:hypothetical protein
MTPDRMSGEENTGMDARIFRSFAKQAAWYKPLGRLPDATL